MTSAERSSKMARLHSCRTSWPALSHMTKAPFGSSKLELSAARPVSRRQLPSVVATLIWWLQRCRTCRLCKKESTFEAFTMTFSEPCTTMKGTGMLPASWDRSRCESAPRQSAMRPRLVMGFVTAVWMFMASAGSTCVRYVSLNMNFLKYSKYISGRSSGMELNAVALLCRMALSCGSTCVNPFTKTIDRSPRRMSRLLP
mmetsp:Transcript_23381/g.73326  ORF Transcript_23381/g.73326 Transcript_23381/m.73326 type:complete len:200 (+) Transcript_23381:1453-2052(+)